ncbi:efflux RND transporter periplasmic adaptor subunit [Hahella aquimaris]|uniref:efflux RND transporter periplasmic adaptor subunit n=1 Tax=Hahella sp. HNIBRBA332 TaxID=3015983 RepID=UPI00273CC5DA|nr:efflux RND transporter periplasmic adaptor subunit [Hahella sp. HNIBRBA332]WLQ15746.1 efflux RND transporter periplasmic adaptor subunit [Hahella sp. HNIBRBA332]
MEKTLMRTRIPTYWISFGIIVALAVWLMAGPVQTAQTEAPEATKQEKAALSKVAYEVAQAETIKKTLEIQGQIDVWRQVNLQSRLGSTVEKVAAERGHRVNQGDLLLTLSEEDLPAQMAQAKAQREVARSELKAAKSLMQRGLQAETELKAKQAALASAEAAVARLEQNLKHTRILAPFAGVVEDRMVELGQTVQEGVSLVRLIDDHKLKLMGQAPQQQIGLLSIGQPVTAHLLNGETLTGRVSYIAAQADADTRSFTVEAELDNPQRLRVAGSTATLNIDVGDVMAHRISAALLSLDEKGRLSVEYLDADQRVARAPVERIRASNTELWVSGLPETVKLITMGRGYAKLGEKVDATPEEELLKHDQDKDEEPDADSASLAMKQAVN